MLAVGSFQQVEATRTEKQPTRKNDAIRSVWRHYIRRHVAVSDWRGVFVRGYHGRMRYRLRTLLILLAVGPLILAGFWWRWQASKAQIEPLLCKDMRAAESPIRRANISSP